MLGKRNSKTMGKIIAASLAFFLAVFYKFIGRSSDIALGEAQAERENAQRLLVQLREVNRIRDRINNDSDYADELRKNFTRKE